MVAPGSFRENVDLTSASGETLAALTRMPGGWQVSGLQTTDRNQLETRGFWRAPLADSTNLATLGWPQLRAGAVPLELARHNGGGQPLLDESVLATGGSRRVDTSEAIVGDTVVVTTTENGTHATQNAVDAGGKLRWAKDAAGHQTHLTYDALGRLIEVTLADGSRQSLQYGAFGHVAKVARAGLSSVEYDYAPITGLGLRKRILDAAGTVERTVEWTRDEIGRITRALHQQPRRNASREIFFRYDGLIDGAIVSGQRGFRSEVEGEDFIRQTQFRRDGKPLSSTITIADWRTLEQSWTYHEDGSAKDETWVVRDGNGLERSRLVQTSVYDAWGRLEEIQIGGVPFASVHYDQEDRADRVDLLSAPFNGQGLIFHFDPATHDKNGYWLDAGTWSSGVDWRPNNRGLVGGEDITVGSQVWTRSHEYDARGFLTRSLDAGGESLSTYGLTGLPASMTDLVSARPITRTATTITAGVGPSSVYQLDTSGRVAGHDDLTLTWGPTGEIDEATRGLRVSARPSPSGRDDAQDATTTGRCETSYVTATTTAAWLGACCSGCRAASQARGRSSATRSAGQSAEILSMTSTR